MRGPGCEHPVRWKEHDAGSVFEGLHTMQQVRLPVGIDHLDAKKGLGHTAGPGVRCFFAAEGRVSGVLVADSGTQDGVHRKAQGAQSDRNESKGAPVEAADNCAAFGQEFAQDQPGAAGQMDSTIQCLNFGATRPLAARSQTVCVELLARKKIVPNAAGRDGRELLRRIPFPEHRQQIQIAVVVPVRPKLLNGQLIRGLAKRWQGAVRQGPAPGITRIWAGLRRHTDAPLRFPASNSSLRIWVFAPGHGARFVSMRTSGQCMP